MTKPGREVSARSRAAAPEIPISTIGYEGTTVDLFLDALRNEGVELLVDVRAVASSRRPGFSKTRLAENLAAAGIEYLHLRGLGTPADGRAAARAGRHQEMREIYLRHLAIPEAQAELNSLEEIVHSGTRLSLMCFERRPEHCHRRVLVEALLDRIPLRVTDLIPGEEERE